MSKRWILAGSTDQTIDVFVQDSSVTTGAGLTGLVHNSAGLTCYYRKGATGTPTALTLVTQTVGGAHTDGGFVAVDGTNCPGQYRLDLSDTIVATAGMVTLYLRGATNMAPVVLEIEVVAVNIFDSVRMGLTALPNAAAAANGGLGTVDANNAVKVQSGSGANQIDLSSGKVLLQATQTGVTIPTVTNVTNGVIAGSLGAQASTDVQEAVDTALGQYAVSGVAKESSITTILNRIGAFTGTGVNTILGVLRAMMRKDGSITTPSDVGGNYDHTTDSQEALRDNTGTAGASLSAVPWNAAWDAEVESEVTDALEARGVTTTVTGRIDAAVSSRSSHTAADIWAVGTRTLTGFGTLVTDIVTAVWAAASRTLTAFSFSVTVGTNSDKTGYSLDLNQTLPQSDVSALTTSTVGHALAAARVQGAGAWAQIGTTLILKNPDGSTFRTFTLDDDEAPTSRT